MALGSSTLENTASAAPGIIPIRYEPQTGLLSVTIGEIRACWELCRLHNNIGFWVVWIPTAWSIAMAYNANPEISGTQALRRAVQYIPLCIGIKSLIMTIDDLLDYDIDALVERTKHRAIPRGAISLERAWVFFCLQTALGIYCAVTFLTPTALSVAATVSPLYIIYPTCKRWTNLAPIPLGLMFNIGAFMGWSDLSADGTIPWKALTPVYLGACFWTIAYETVYQHQDKVDDKKIGLHSPALLLGKQTIPVCTLCCMAFLTLVTYGGIETGHGLLFCVSMLIAGALLLIGLWRTNIDSPDDCRKFFMGTPSVGQIILVGLILDGIASRYSTGNGF
ncbi:UbiA prenyltransferase [Mycena alexandri]|uniref:UbiA prenyltransferase n=1 Tax=Mycena alexandri TaxID=1745969 RepID=A0AAD6X6U1_9AGAR|nr:UbiA prenyltransferase [Mycena alexandri]